jgi:hypothetical protein
MKKKYWLALTLLILGIVVPLQATSVQRLSLDDLISKAGSIVEANLLSTRTYRSPDGKLILTSYTFSVQESLKGSTGSTVTVTTVGGRDGNTILHVSGMPVFQTGKKAILFLEQSGTYTTVVGLNQGKFTISNGEVSNDMTGLSFPDGQTGKQVKMPLDEFKRQVKTRLNR